MWSVDAIAVPFTHTCHIGGEEEEDIDERSGEDWLTSTYKIIMLFVIEISGWEKQEEDGGAGSGAPLHPATRNRATQRQQRRRDTNGHHLRGKHWSPQVTTCRSHKSLTRRSPGSLRVPLT